MKKIMGPAYVLLLFVFLCFPQAGQTSDGQEQAGDINSDRMELDPIIVVASKSPRPLSKVAAQVTVITADDILAGMAEDLDGMLKYEPGLDMEIAGTRFGATSINVRGIGGDSGEGRIFYRRFLERWTCTGGVRPDQACGGTVWLRFCYVRFRRSGGGDGDYNLGSC
jgi:hypothetical protein